MPYVTIRKVPPQVKIHKGVHLNLNQANYWAKVYDGLVASGKDKGTASRIAWYQFEKEHKIVGNHWEGKNPRRDGKGKPGRVRQYKTRRRLW